MIVMNMENALFLGLATERERRRGTGSGTKYEGSISSDVLKSYWRSKDIKVNIMCQTTAALTSG